MYTTTYGTGEQAPRQFAILYEPTADEDGPDTATVAGYGMEFADGIAVFVWTGSGGGHTLGQFGSAERALGVVGLVHPARLVWLSPTTSAY